MIAGSEWPNLAATTCSGTPAISASVAEVVRRMLGNPVAATVRLNWAVGTVPNGARVSHVTHKQVTTHSGTAGGEPHRANRKKRP